MSKSPEFAGCQPCSMRPTCKEPCTELLKSLPSMQNGRLPQTESVEALAAIELAQKKAHDDAIEDENTHPSSIPHNRQGLPPCKAREIASRG